MGSRLVFGYRHVAIAPPCPCRDSGSYISMSENEDNVLEFTLRCWCGRQISGTFDDLEDRARFLEAQGL